MFGLAAKYRPRPPEYRYAECPRCGQDCETFFLDINRAVVACDCCWTPETDFDSTAEALYYEDWAYGY